MNHARSIVPTTTPRLLSCVAILTSLWAAEASGHDYWLAQEPWSLQAGDTCTMRLLVGDDLKSELERPLQSDMTTRYQWYTPNETRDLLATAVDGVSPVFRSKVVTSGQSLLVMDRKFHEIDTTVGEFLEFLAHEEQLELGQAYESVDPDEPLTRRYARNIKALIRVGDPTEGEFHSAKVGQQLEIRLLQAPHALALGDLVTIHVQFMGHDLANQIVKMMVKQEGGTVLAKKGTTDELGRVQFSIDRPGLWVVRVAYLEQCGDCDVDWDTHYSTLSFVYR